jgi:excisionase family DNA binding protein
MMDRATELLTTRELAKRLGVTPETVRVWARRGAIPTLRLSPKVIRYNPDAVVAALSATPTKGAGENA